MNSESHQTVETQKAKAADAAWASLDDRLRARLEADGVHGVTDWLELSDEWKREIMRELFEDFKPSTVAALPGFDDAAAEQFEVYPEVVLLEGLSDGECWQGLGEYDKVIINAVGDCDRVISKSGDEQFSILHLLRFAQANGEAFDRFVREHSG